MQFIYFDILDNKKKELASQSPLWISEDLEWWHDRSNDPVPRFVQIASLYSELIAVSTSGQLYQWKWTESEPYKNADVLTHFNNAIFFFTRFYKICIIDFYRIQMCIIQKPFHWH